MAEGILWLGVVLIALDALTWFWDCVKYKAWDIDKWSKHLSTTIKAVRKEFKHALHKKIYYAMLLMLLALEIGPYTIIGWGLANNIISKLAIVLLAAIAITNTIRNIVILGTKSEKTLKFVAENKIAVVAYNVLVTILSIYALGISIYKILNTFGLV